MPKTFTLEQVDAAKALLSSLPERPQQPKPLNLAESIREMKSEIKAALNRGYTLEEIEQSLKDNQFDVGVPTLRAYLYRKNRAATPTVNKRETRNRTSEPNPSQTVKLSVHKSTKTAVTMPQAEEL